MPDQLSGEALDARFFEVCCKTRREDDGRLWVFLDAWWSTKIPPVSTDANCCEAWAMRWAREQGLYWAIENDLKDIRTGERYDWACLWAYEGDEPVNQSDGHGTDWKEAFVRACVAAGQILKQAKGGA